MNLSKPFILRPVMTTFVMLAIFIAGVISFLKLPVSDVPAIEKPVIKISTSYTGANPETILNQVTIPLEKELALVKGVEEMSSTSSPGFSEIHLGFGLSKDMNEAIREIQAAIAQAEWKLPREIDMRPTYQLEEGNKEPILFLLLTSDHSNTGELHTLADTMILPRLNRIEGIAKIELYGPAKSYWLKVNPELLAARGLGFNQLIDSIKQHTSEVPLGRIQTSTKNLNIELGETIKDPKKIEEIFIGGTLIKVKDVAEISDQSDHGDEVHLVTPDKNLIALVMGIQKVSEGNTVAIAKAVKAQIAALQKELPASVNLQAWFDKSIWIEESILDVEGSLLIAFLLVVLVIYFTLGRKSEAFIASTALPLSLLGTCIAMIFCGFTLDLLSLLALTLSVGFVVDDAIVVLENIVRNQEKGESVSQAALTGSRQICFTVLSMTISLVAVFIPLLFMGGMDGRLFREFSVTLAIAILFSGFISLSLTPMLCSRFLKEHGALTPLQKRIAAINELMTNLYGKTLKIAFRFPKSCLLMAFSTLILSIFLFTKLPVNLVPPEDRGFLFSFVRMPSGLGTKEKKAIQSALEGKLQGHPYIESFVDISMGDTLIFLLRLHPMPLRPPQPQAIAEFQPLFDSLPGIQTFIQGYQLINLNIEFGQPGQFQMDVRALTFEEVNQGAASLIEAMQTHPDVSFAMASVSNDTPKLVVHVNELLAKKLGFNRLNIQQLLQNAYGQSAVATFQNLASQEKVYLELMSEYQDNAAALAKLYLEAPSGKLVPLKTLATWEETLGTPSLSHLDQLPSQKINFSLKPGVSPNAGLKNIQDLSAGVLPSGVSAKLSGSALSVTKTIRNTLLLLLAATCVMYIVLGILYESFIHPLTILSSIPCAGLGGILTLFLFNEPISLFSAVGFLVLIGIVKKNGIMMIDFALEARKTGSSAEEAIYQGCLARFRPIMMTTIAAVMGALPIAIGIGEGAEIRQGLGLVVVGGLLFSQVLTLYFTPILYLTFERLKSAGAGNRKALNMGI